MKTTDPVDEQQFAKRGHCSKEITRDSAVRLSSYGFTMEVGRALKHSASPRATQRFPCALPTSRVHPLKPNTH